MIFPTIPPMISLNRLIMSDMTIGGYAIYPPIYPLFTPYDGTTAMAHSDNTDMGGQPAARAVPAPF